MFIDSIFYILKNTIALYLIDIDRSVILFNQLSLPDEVEDILKELSVPPRLYAHLLLVHDVANKLINSISVTWNNLSIDKNLVLFGAATHDIGKCIHTGELFEEGHRHEQDGKRLLTSLGVPQQKAKFAATHATWSTKSSIEELCVSLADKVWKGSRISDLEDLLIAKIFTEIQVEHWEIFSLLDSIIEDITKDSDARLSFQNNFPTMYRST